MKTMKLFESDLSSEDETSDDASTESYDASDDETDNMSENDSVNKEGEDDKEDMIDDEETEEQQREDEERQKDEDEEGEKGEEVADSDESKCDSNEDVDQETEEDTDDENLNESVDKKTSNSEECSHNEIKSKSNINSKSPQTKTEGYEHGLSIAIENRPDSPEQNVEEMLENANEIYRNLHNINSNEEFADVVNKKNTNSDTREENNTIEMTETDPDGEIDIQVSQNQINEVDFFPKLESKDNIEAVNDIDDKSVELNKPISEYQLLSTQTKKSEMDIKNDLEKEGIVTEKHNSINVLPTDDASSLNTDPPLQQTKISDVKNPNVENVKLRMDSDCSETKVDANSIKYDCDVIETSIVDETYIKGAHESNGNYIENESNKNTHDIQDVGMIISDSKDDKKFDDSSQTVSQDISHSDHEQISVSDISKAKNKDKKKKNKQKAKKGENDQSEASIADKKDKNKKEKKSKKEKNKGDKKNTEIMTVTSDKEINANTDDKKTNDDKDEREIKEATNVTGTDEPEYDRGTDDNKDGKEIEETKEYIEIGETKDNKDIDETNDSKETDETKDNKETDETRDNKETDETKENKETDETKDNKENDETKDNKVTDETKDNKETDETKDNKENKEIDRTKDNRETGETKDNKETDETKDNKETDEIKDNIDIDETKDNKETDETKDNKETDETKDNKDIDDTKDNEKTDETKDSKETGENNIEKKADDTKDDNGTDDTKYDDSKAFDTKYDKESNNTIVDKQTDYITQETEDYKDDNFFCAAETKETGIEIVGIADLKSKMPNGDEVDEVNYDEISPKIKRTSPTVVDSSNTIINGEAQAEKIIKSQIVENINSNVLKPILKKDKCTENMGVDSDNVSLSSDPKSSRLVNINSLVKRQEHLSDMLLNIRRNFHAMDTELTSFKRNTTYLNYYYQRHFPASKKRRFTSQQ